MVTLKAAVQQWTVQLEIEKLIYGGDGLARLPADDQGRRKAVFVPFVLEGEQVEARLDQHKPEFARAHVDQVLRPSPHRIEPKCPYFHRCGGCHYQHTTYEHQLEIKAAILKESLTRIAKFELMADLQVHPSPPWNYRNRTRMRVRPSPFALGYNRMWSHVFLAVDQCPISSPLINRAIAEIWELGRTGVSFDQISEIEFFASAEDSELQIELHPAEDTPEAGEAARHLTPQLAGKIPEMATVAVSVAAPIPPRSPEVIVGPGAIFYKTRDAAYRVSPGSFFQINRYLTDELIQIVTAGRTGNTAIDYYAGVGLFAVPLARRFERVIAVESSQTSFSDLQYNAPANIRAVQATAEQHLKNATSSQQKIRADLVVVDPPRGGLGQTVAQALGRLGPPRVTYVSCDPATLARDLKVLLEFGYKVEQAHLVDLFPQTYHLETVLNLVR